MKKNGVTTLLRTTDDYFSLSRIVFIYYMQVNMDPSNFFFFNTKELCFIIHITFANSDDSNQGAPFLLIKYSICNHNQNFMETGSVIFLKKKNTGT